MMSTAKKARGLSANSRTHRFGMIDGRTKEAAYLRRVRAELTSHVGGAPDAVQRLIIERLCVISLRLALFDEKFAAGKQVSELDNRTYGALHSQYRLMLQQLGPAAAAKPITADEHIARLAAREAAERAERGVTA